MNKMFRNLKNSNKQKNNCKIKKQMKIFNKINKNKLNRIIKSKINKKIRKLKLKFKNQFSLN